MKIAKVIEKYERFENNIEDLIRYAQEIIADLPYEKKIPSKQKEMLLESLLLRACALWCVFRRKSATHSDSNRPPIPFQSGRGFRSKPATF